MIRLFVALAIPGDLAMRLTSLRGQIPDARWVPAETMHITLRFIGELNEGLAADIEDALTGVEAPVFDATVRGVGRFDSRGRVRSLWAGVDRDREIKDLHARIETACRHAGLAPEGRKFHPHVTLARCRGGRLERVASFLAEHGAFAAPSFAVDSFGLYSSALGRAGPVYTREVEYPLVSH